MRQKDNVPSDAGSRARPFVVAPPKPSIAGTSHRGAAPSVELASSELGYSWRAEKTRGSLVRSVMLRHPTLDIFPEEHVRSDLCAFARTGCILSFINVADQ